jgi:hypothetical protein
MSATKTLLASLALALAATGCATHKINYKNPNVAAGPTHTAKQSFFLWGLAGGNDIDLDKMCPAGVAGIESKSSGGDSILHWLTAGLYSPMSVAVTCASATPVATKAGDQ